MLIEQVQQDNRLSHFINIQGLPRAIINRLFERADDYLQGNRKRTLTGKLVVLIFYESSTRTRTAFEASAKQLGADVVSLDQIQMAGSTKKESLTDTIKTVAAMGAAGIVLRHGEDRSSELAVHVAPPGIAIINGGDGCYSHPTQALTDAYTLRQRFGDDFSTLSFAIVGDILHSRVARSNIHMLRLMGAKKIRLIGPPNFCPSQLQEEFQTDIFHDMDKGLVGVDVVMLLRIQFERQTTDEPDISENYHLNYGLTAARMRALKPTAVVMHPGPINRGMEITDEVADGEQSIILQQVSNGMAIRFALLSDILS